MTLASSNRCESVCAPTALRPGSDDPGSTCQDGFCRGSLIEMWRRRTVKTWSNGPAPPPPLRPLSLEERVIGARLDPRPRRRWLSSTDPGFAVDSPLERDGFELLVPRENAHSVEPSSFLYLSEIVRISAEGARQWVG